MTCVGHYAIKPPIYEKLVEKKNRIHTNDMVDMDSYLYQVFNICDKCFHYIHKI